MKNTNILFDLFDYFDFDYLDCQYEMETAGERTQEKKAVL